jgi:hypothetical protein
VAKEYVDRKSQNPANLGTQDQCSRSKVFFLKQILNGEKKKRAASVSPSRIK